VYGTDFGVHTPVWISRFTDATRQAAAYRKRLAGIISGLDIHYELGEGHPLLGRRMADLDLLTTDGPARLFTLLHNARPVLLNLGEPGGFDITPWADRVRLIDSKYAGLWELPVLGTVAAPGAVLIRPDGYVAWVGDLADPALPEALSAWFGAPRASADAAAVAGTGPRPPTVPGPRHSRDHARTLRRQARSCRMPPPGVEPGFAA
jgi:hypothetical protein